MNRQVTIQLEPPMFDYISTKAAENNETVSTYISNYILQTLALPKGSTKNTVVDQKAKKKALLRSLRGMLSNSSINDEEAKEEYIAEKYALWEFSLTQMS